MTLAVLGESRRGVSPPRAPRTVREPLGSYGSRCSAADIQQAPMDKESWLGSDDPSKPVPCPRGPRAEPLVLIAAPADQVGVYPPQGLEQYRFVEMAVVVDPTCQSARNRDPGSACKKDPPCRR